MLNNTQEVPQEVAVQEKQVKKTTKKTDKKESEDKAKKTITWVSDDGEKITFIISIDEEGETKISGIDTDMLIKIDKDSDGNTFTLHVDDKNLVLQKDEKGNWSLREDEGENLSYRLSTSQKQDKTYSIVYRKKGDKDDKNVFYIEAPKIHIEKLEKPKGAFNVHVSPKIVLPNKTFDIHIVGEEGEKKRIEFAPHMNVHMVPHVSAISLDHSDLDQKELKEKLEEITEKLKEIREKNELEMSKESKEEALKEVEEMLKKLSEELKEKKVELKDMALSIHTDAEAVHLEKSKNAVVKDILLNITGKLEKKKNEYVVVDIKESDDNKWVAKKDKVSDIDILEGKKVTFVTTEGGEIQISMKAHFDSKSKAQYDEVIEKLKKDLPAGYTVESIIDEEAELITINIRGTQKDETADITVKDILKKLEEQLSSIK